MSYHWSQLGLTITYEIGGLGKKKMAHGGHSTLYLGSIIAFTADFMVQIERSEAPFQRQYYPIFKGRMNIYTKNKFRSFIFFRGRGMLYQNVLNFKFAYPDRSTYQSKRLGCYCIFINQLNSFMSSTSFSCF